MSVRVALCCVVAVLVGSTAQQEDAWRLSVEPRIQFVKAGQPATIMCALRDGAGKSVPITSCGFQEYYNSNTWDWDMGPASHAVDQKVGGYMTTAEYHGLGLQHGECGINITVGSSHGSLVLGCRVKIEDNGPWVYETAAVGFTKWQTMQYTLQPPGVLLADPGSDVMLLGTADRELFGCAFSLQSNNIVIVLDPHNREDNTSSHHAWQRDRNCGLTWKTVQPDQSGFVVSWVYTVLPQHIALDLITLIVKTPPASPPLLTINVPEEGLETGDLLNATCFVNGSRPVANITWLLDGDVIRHDTFNQARNDSTWRWVTDMQPIMQTLSHRVTAQDRGKVLTCQAGHSALPSGFLSSKDYVIRFKDVGHSDS